MRIAICMVIILFLVNCGGEPQAEQPDGSKQKTPAEEIISEAINTQLSAFLAAYFKLKEALVEGDGEAAHLAATRLQERYDAFPAVLHSGENKALSVALGKKLNSLAGETELEAQRTAFYPLSESVIMLAKTWGPLDVPLYVQHCPMAFENSGADWLSKTEEIMNPYFGDAMIHCGSVKETIVAGN